MGTLWLSDLKQNSTWLILTKEWLNGTGKRGGGIVGITKSTTTLTRWALSYNLRVHIASQIRELYNVHLSLDDEIKNNESTASRMTKDCDQQGALKDTLK